MKTISVCEYTCNIGNNATENWNLLEKSYPNHLFFHLTHYPSCYVILATEEKIDLETIMLCAKICKQHTKYNHLQNVSVDCCKCVNVKKGDQVGECIYKSQRKIIKVLV